MDLREIKLIVDLMKKSELTEFEIEQKDLKLKIKRSGGQQAGAEFAASNHLPYYPAQAPAAALPPPAPSGNSTPPTPVAVEETGVGYIKSPMVGTFYRSPSPESAPFVEIGAKVSETSVVCILEAMKIMNEIQAEAKGTILEALIENGQPVEFGQKLFKIKLG